jgi:glutathione S-transferase
MEEIMKLYYLPVSTYSQKALLALYEKAVEFERELVYLQDPEARKNYEALYPLGKVPLLMVDGDHMIPESSIIIEYLEGHFSTGTKLIPDTVDEARQVRFMDRMCDLYLDNPVVKLLFQGMKPEAEQNLEEQATAKKQLGINYQHMNQRLAGQDWLCGSGFSMADCAAIPPLFYAQQVYPFENYENITAYYERAKSRPSYQQVLEEALPVWESMQAAMK